MVNINKNSYLLFGNPVNHSKSPIIYQLFSKQTKINFHYNIQCIDKKHFFQKILFFFKKYGYGANITVPFKESAYQIANVLTKRAQIAKSVNTFKKIQYGKILGDNTDGVGCLYDLKRLHAIRPGARILLIGAGGAARGIIPNLLSLSCSIDIVNRTFHHAEILVSFFKNLGCINVIDLKNLKEFNYDLVINSTSMGIDQDCDFFISNVVFYPNKTFFYDLYYNTKLTPFLKWCKFHKAIYYSDGIGMLVSQAAYSFYLWNDIFPNVLPVINILNQEKEYCLYNNML